MFIYNNFRFCYLCIWKISSTNIFRIYVKENIKTKNYINEELKSESDADSDSDNYSDNDIDIDIEE